MAFRTVSRKTWEASPAKSRPHKAAWAGGVTIRVHHTAGSADGLARSRDAERAVMRSIQRFHQEFRGWSDIAYSYVVFPSGRVYVGRGFDVMGAHTLGHNEDIGVCFAGNFEQQKPTKRSLVAYWLLRRRLRKRGARIIGTRPHRATSSTSCPGDNLVRALRLS